MSCDERKLKTFLQCSVHHFFKAEFSTIHLERTSAKRPSSPETEHCIIGMKSRQMKINPPLVYLVYCLCLCTAASPWRIWYGGVLLYLRDDVYLLCVGVLLHLRDGVYLFCVCVLLHLRDVCPGGGLPAVCAGVAAPGPHRLAPPLVRAAQQLQNNSEDPRHLDAGPDPGSTSWKKGNRWLVFPPGCTFR